MNGFRITAIVLAAGQGKRMGSAIHKQYLLLRDKPVLYYSLKVFEDSQIDDIILVVGKGEQKFCENEILNKYGFHKVRAIVEGGKERYHSVANGIRAISWDCQYILIHDGARPFVDNEIVDRVIDEVQISKACVAGMPVKDTIKISDEDGYILKTPTRSSVWQVQTPQAFDRNVIADAYSNLLSEEENMSAAGITVTDDAMVVEYFMKIPVKLIQGSYKNIKITTPEDLRIAEILLE